jgi:hypothetical protein
VQGRDDEGGAGLWGVAVVTMRILSLGAGVQSSTLALMIAHGEIPMVSAAIFADTGAEPRATYEYLDYLIPLLPFTVHVVSNGNLHDDQLVMSSAKDGTEYLRNLVPAFTFENGNKEGMLLRKCTGDYKLAPLRRKSRELMEAAGEKTIEQVIGISWDEAIRMKPSGVKYISNTYPLVDLQMTRGHCLEWLKAKGYRLPPKSACIFCPYHSDEQWKSLPPDELARAARFERIWNEQAKLDKRATQTRATIRLHRSGLPLGQVNFNTSPADFGQADFFGADCEGMCGV